MTATGFWRSLHGILAALLLFGLTAAPGLEQLICADDAAAVSHATEASHPAGEDPHDPAQDPSHGACQHGHCHHGGAVAAPGVSTVVAPHPHALDHRLVLVTGQPADRQFGLIRPPRA